MKVAVLEYICGGGLLGEPKTPMAVYRSLYREGLAMLSALAIDLTRCGHEVHSCLDQNASADPLFQRLSMSCPQLRVCPVDIQWQEHWIEVALQCDRTIVIVPELHQQLELIVQSLRSAGAAVVASSQRFLQTTSDKWETANHFHESGVCHPATQSLTQYKLSKSFGKELDGTLPVTLKRRDGAGCAGMMHFVSQRMLLARLESPDANELNGEDWIVQQWHVGQSVSMAIMAGDEWTVVGAVEQSIELLPAALSSASNTYEYSNVSYLGGSGPLTIVPNESLDRLAIHVRDALPSGAAGWIGIDFIIPISMRDENDLIVIEVNPRLTTSYLGYRQWYGHELSDLIVGNANLVDWKRAKILERIEFG